LGGVLLLLPKEGEDVPFKVTTNYSIRYPVLPSNLCGGY
jgi:hypothetical protein